MEKSHVLVLFGSTATGKSDLALAYAQQYDGEIINADVGQFYAPLSIGTAKPSFDSELIKHHLFDVFNTPDDFNVVRYRSAVLAIIRQIWNRGKLPIIVGGSTYYIHALFFPAQDYDVVDTKDQNNNEKTHQESWKILQSIDPQRAQEIHPRDIYRIRRALAIFYKTGKKPSDLKPFFDPIAPFCAFYVTRNQDDLCARILQRTEAMIQQGWIDEVKSIEDTPWIPFLIKKKLIGYPEIIGYLQNQQQDVNELIQVIAQKTRHYAKRQRIFFNRLSRLLKFSIGQHGTQNSFYEIDLSSITLTDAVQMVHSTLEKI